MSYLVFMFSVSLCLFLTSLFYSSFQVNEIISKSVAKANISLRYIFNVIV